MRLIYLIIYTFIGNYLYSQTCVVDGLKVEPIGLTEFVNNEHLSLYRCSEGHQMWLTSNEVKIPKNPVLQSPELQNSVNNIIVSGKESTNALSKNLNLMSENKNIESSILPSVKKIETMSKKESLSSKFSSSLNIQKFGLETLLHKKIESDRRFNEKLDSEKAELLHLMYTQKKIFDRVDENKFSFKKNNIFSYSNIIYVAISITLTSYLVF